MQAIKRPLCYLRLISSMQKILSNQSNMKIACYYATTIDLHEFGFNEYLQKPSMLRNNPIQLKNFDLRFYNEQESILTEISDMSLEELDNFLLHLMSKNKHKQVERIVSDCCKTSRPISETILKKMLTDFSLSGKPELILNIQKYCEKNYPQLYKRNGEFLHYLAQAQCLKGNSDKGLMILMDGYNKYKNLRSCYRITFRDVIQDSVANRSEASLVTFKKYVLKFSNDLEDHYPLVCLWHICWSSDWFSDQMLSDELLVSSKVLQEIVRDKAAAFSITILREHNEDAVLRLLQYLLKYKMMTDYVKVLEVLFNHKLKKADVRGCIEILRNCEALGVSLPTTQQGRFVKMLINSNYTNKLTAPNFKLKF